MGYVLRAPWAFNISISSLPGLTIHTIEITQDLNLSTPLMRVDSLCSPQNYSKKIFISIFCSTGRMGDLQSFRKAFDRLLKKMPFSMIIELEIHVQSLPCFIAYISALSGFPLRIKLLVLLWLACLVYMAS